MCDQERGSGWHHVNSYDHRGGSGATVVLPAAALTMPWVLEKEMRWDEWVLRNTCYPMLHQDRSRFLSKHPLLSDLDRGDRLMWEELWRRNKRKLSTWSMLEEGRGCFAWGLFICDGTQRSPHPGSWALGEEVLCSPFPLQWQSGHGVDLVLTVNKAGLSLLSVGWAIWRASFSNTVNSKWFLEPGINSLQRFLVNCLGRSSMTYY